VTWLICVNHLVLSCTCEFVYVCVRDSFIFDLTRSSTRHGSFALADVGKDRNIIAICSACAQTCMCEFMTNPCQFVVPSYRRNIIAICSACAQTCMCEFMTNPCQLVAHSYRKSIAAICLACAWTCMCEFVTNSCQLVAHSYQSNVMAVCSACA